VSETRFLSLKVDVDTHDGMRDGAPRLLETFRQEGVKATFFLSFGPDNAGKAILNVFKQKGFLKKMVKTSAPSLYGIRTILSGTLLPARPIATKFPEIVRQIESEGHECEIHAWDHRRWQDHIESMTLKEIEKEFHRSGEAYQNILNHPARAVAAPSWKITNTVIKAEAGMGLVYASDLRGGPPCFLKSDIGVLSPLQIPTTGPCLEELLTLGVSREDAWISRITDAALASSWPVIALHAEVEGGPYYGFLKTLLDTLKSSGFTFVPLNVMAQILHKQDKTRQNFIPVRRLSRTSLPGRSGWVSTSIKMAE
jgi:peptidoglycan/xylan/chitin deacetylase (PgdA/CDA1 family)